MTTPKNLAFVLGEQRKFYYEMRPLPTQPEGEDVTVAVYATGLCGSNVCAH